MGNVRVSSDRGICSAALPEAAGRAALSLRFRRNSRVSEKARRKGLEEAEETLLTTIQ